MYLYEIRFKVKKKICGKKAEVRIMEKSTEMIKQHRAKTKQNKEKTKSETFSISAQKLN